MKRTTEIDGICAVHAIVTDGCRANRGDVGVIDETLRRIRAQFESVLAGWAPGSGAKFHVVLTVERPGD
jgi:hypothetical protein